MREVEQSVHLLGGPFEPARAVPPEGLRIVIPGRRLPIQG
jgi:hypothetical protein